MIATKAFEVRDRGTFIPVLTVVTSSEQSRENWLFRRAAYDGQILLVHLTSRRTEYDPEVWDNRTMKTAHRYIRDHWDLLHGGEVIDVRFILGETPQPCDSERIMYE